MRNSVYYNGRITGTTNTFVLQMWLFNVLLNISGCCVCDVVLYLITSEKAIISIICKYKIICKGLLEESIVYILQI